MCRMCESRKRPVDGQHRIMDCRRVPASPSGQPTAGYLAALGPKPLSVLVTGSSGYIDTHVVRQLHAAGHRVTAIDILKPKFPLPDRVEFRQCDIRQDHFPNRVFDAVVHLAALAGVRPSMTHPIGYHSTNARLHGLRFVALRSISVWGPGQRPDLALEAFTHRIVAGQPLVINGDGSQRRDLEPVVRIYNRL
jgi:nucleoside-diphosphate-sugar epimerase